MNETSRHSYPLGALFVLVALCGVLAALVAPLARAIAKGAVSWGDLGLAMAAGATIASLIGAAVGAHHRRWIVGGLTGLMIGGAVGAACAPLALIPASGFPGLLFASIGGSIVMLVIGSAMRWASGK